MPPPGTKKLTAQPVRTRHFAGKPAAAEVEERDSSDDSEAEQEKQKPKRLVNPKPAPLASSFPKSALKSHLAARKKQQNDLKHLEDEFETESEGEEEKGDGNASGSDSGSGSGSSSEEESSEEESSSEEEAPRKLLRPVFVKKGQRDKTNVKSAEEIAAEIEQQRKEEAKAMVQAQIEERAAAKANKRDWDDDVVEADINAVNDTDNLDPEAEYAAWRLREFKRIKRERLAIEEAEAERAEIDRRRNLTEAERDAEDREFLEKQKEERDDRGQMQFMQKYFHKGAFFQEDLAELGLDKRNLMGARFEDQTDRQVLPEYMQIRDMTKLGKKGRTRYRDMKTEDTGKWGDFGNTRRPRDKGDHDLDERFRSDGYNGRDRDEGATGANAKPLGDRKRFGDDTGRESKRPRVDDRD